MVMNASPSSWSGIDECTDPETHAESSTPVPVIDLPHRWDENGYLLPGTSPSRCPICRWNGDPESFWDQKRSRSFGTPSAGKLMTNCALCKLLRCILLKRAEMEGRRVRYKSWASGPGFHVQTQIDAESEDVYHSIFVSSDTPKSNIDRYDIPRRFISNDDGLNRRSAEWAQERLVACASSHGLCRPRSGVPFLPTRLINLEPGWKGLDVRLESSSYVRSRSSYVALSYCWGDYRPACITTAETLAQNQSRIAWDKLPATFQDAAAFTRSLGVQYLWIDSLYIIQEDEDDWRREAGKMCGVYENAYLTLAAVFGGASTSGLRNKSIKQDSQLVAELHIAQNVYPLYMRRAHYLDSLWDFNIMDYLERKALASRYPLLRRAWAYQERIISPRVIFFTESEMIFECPQSVECECGAAQAWCQTGNFGCSNKTSIFRQTESDSLKLKGNDVVSERSLYDIQAEDSQDRDIAKSWRRLVVKEYSLLEVSMPRDRLPAVGAIAEKFKRIRAGETYLAGLWSMSLLDDLLWACKRVHYSSGNFKAKLERPFSLPTWCGHLCNAKLSMKATCMM